MITDESNSFSLTTQDANHPARFEIAIDKVFNVNDKLEKGILSGLGIRRHLGLFESAAYLLLDSFCEDHAQCAFLRLPVCPGDVTSFSLGGPYTIVSSQAGGWLIRSRDDSLPNYWIPRLPVIRKLDDDKHVLKEIRAEIITVNAFPNGIEVALRSTVTGSLDTVLWQFAINSRLIAEFDEWLNLEMQPYFMWSSHTLYRKPSDIYSHLIYGHVYENHAVWPRYWTVCSELDAYSLYVMLSGLEKATGKQIYNLLQNQIVLSVIARQDENGGWSHGEWTDNMESHYRLCAGGLHLLAAAYEKNKDATLLTAMDKAANFLATRIDHLDKGIWFLHDSLETNLETLKSFPFRWIYSRALGKSPSNMLALNTHLDTALALDRYQAVSGDKKYADLIDSAHASTQAVLELKPAEWLYKLIFRAIGLTLLPTPIASRLPLPLRALKRLSWKYLIPKLAYVKAYFPRFMMPGGHIERDLSQCSFSDQYQSVTLMDLLRYSRRFPNVDLPDFFESLQFTHSSGLREKWKESRDKDHALGFWTEALYHLCMLYPEPVYRQWLLSGVIDAENHGLGLSPSVLGSHPEIAPLSDQFVCPSPNRAELRVVNLGHGTHPELIVINPTDAEIPMDWEVENKWFSSDDFQWCILSENKIVPVSLPLRIPPRCGAWGILSTKK